MEETQPTFSIIIPAYNERWRIPATLIEMLDFFDAKGQSYEIIVVDDGSSDDTAQVVHKFERYSKRLKLIRLPRNTGKGYAVKSGVLQSNGQRILFADADGSTPIAELTRLEMALEQGFDVAIGSRALWSEETRIETSWHRKYLGRLFNFCINLMLLPGVADTQCGFKMFTRRAAMFLFARQTSRGFSFDVELLYMARKAGMRVAEIPINWINVPGSKVNLLLDALRMFWDVFWFRVRHGGIKPSDFVRD